MIETVMPAVAVLLQDNNFTGALPRPPPGSMAWQNLITLRLSNNELSGQLPDIDFGQVSFRSLDSVHWALLVCSVYQARIAAVAGPCAVSVYVYCLYNTSQFSSCARLASRLSLLL